MREFAMQFELGMAIALKISTFAHRKHRTFHYFQVTTIIPDQNQCCTSQ